MIDDPIPRMQRELKALLLEQEVPSPCEFDAEISSFIRWRPHVLEFTGDRRAWYLHAYPPETDSWWKRAERAARSLKGNLRLGVAAPFGLFKDEAFLDQCDELQASIAVLSDGKSKPRLYGSAADLIYERGLILSSEIAERILDRALRRSLDEPNRQRKGVLLEVLVAVILSQVEGFEVKSVGVSNRTQQMDVFVHNRNAGGSLGNSAVVLAEAKNWKNPVSVAEYAAFIRKLSTRHGRAKLGFFVTTGRFTAGVDAERRRDSSSDHLVVLIDGQVLPSIWRTSATITAQIEGLALTATIGH